MQPSGGRRHREQHHPEPWMVLRLRRSSPPDGHPQRARARPSRRMGPRQPGAGPQGAGPGRGDVVAAAPTAESELEMLTPGFYEWSARAGSDYSPPARYAAVRTAAPAAVAAPDVGRRRPDPIAADTLAAPADHLVDVGDLDDEATEREQVIRELADLLGPDPVGIVDALNDLDRVPAERRGGSIRNRIEGRKAALEAGFRSRGLPIDHDLIDTLARDATRHASGWRNSAPASGSVSLTER